MLSKTLPHHHGNIKTEEMLSEKLQNTAQFNRAAGVFRQLSDSNRLRIYWLLCHCEECVINISAMVEMSSPAVAHHLRSLKESGLIVSRRVGKEVYYRASETAQSRFLDSAAEKLMAISCPTEAQQEDPQCKSANCAPMDASHGPLMETVHEYLVQNLDRRISVEELAKQFHINTTTLKTQFKAVYGTSLAAHIKTHRMERAAVLLATSQKTVGEIAGAVGYTNASKFSDAFRALYKLSPKAYRKAARKADGVSK